MKRRHRPQRRPPPHAVWPSAAGCAWKNTEASAKTSGAAKDRYAPAHKGHQACGVEIALCSRSTAPATAPSAGRGSHILRLTITLWQSPAYITTRWRKNNQTPFVRRACRRPSGRQVLLRTLDNRGKFKERQSHRRKAQRRQRLRQVFADLDQIAVRVAEIDRHHWTSGPDTFNRAEFHHHTIGREPRTDLIQWPLGDQAEIT